MSLQVPATGAKPRPLTPNPSPDQPTRSIAATAKAIAPYKARLRRYANIAEKLVDAAKVDTVAKEVVKGKK